ncbi:MAG: glycosyltransferase family 2 protein, partial [Anaerolineales bacterium]|nr:glycosyltransferase family 2 protein [Anaerolineales bacterium]
MDNEIIVSVIIPSYNRQDSLLRALDGLKTQTFPPDKFEVIVVVDGSTDGTVEMLRNYQAPYSLNVIEQTNQGSSKSRNNGVAQAQGKILFFQDNDLEATPPLLDVHIKTHGDSTDRVVIGYSLPVIPDQTDWLHSEHRLWWYNFFYRKRQPGFRYCFRDLAGCNFSIGKELFNRVGGFDSELTDFCHEDIELGLRLLKTGARFIFAPEALGYHHVLISYDQNFRRRREEGKVEVRMARKHPEIWPALPPGADLSPSFMSRMMRNFAFTRPGVGDKIAAFMKWTLTVLEKLRMFQRWQRHLNGLHHYWNWRGVAEELGTQTA